MKKGLKLVATIALMLCGLMTFAQNVGINEDGSVADGSAMLDVKATDKGILIPRIALDSTGDITTITTPANGLLVYNTATAGTPPANVTPGFYYWNGTKWLAFSHGTTWREFVNDVPSDDVNDRIYRIGKVVLGFEKEGAFDGMFETDFDASADVTLYSKGNIMVGDVPDTDPIGANGIGNFGYKWNGYRGYWNGDKIAASIMSDYSPSPSCGDSRVTDMVFSLDDGTIDCFNEVDDPTVEVMRLTFDGRMGLGTNDPTQAKLVVNGFVDNTLNYGYLNNTGLVGAASGTNGYSIYASHRIAAAEFNAFSDERIKNIIGQSNTKSDLETLAQIEITNYTMIDTISNGNKMVKKVIAQQVNEVYPQAVTNNIKEFIPNIYQIMHCDSGYIQSNVAVKKGDRIRLIFENGQKDVVINNTNSEGFYVNEDFTGKVFVYGTEVSDFHSVDYQAISMLNVSATQELLKRVNELETKNQKLTQELEVYKTSVEERLTRLEQVQNLNNISQNK